MQTIDQFIENLPRAERLIVERLRGIVLETDPRLQEKFSYGVPYYYHHRMILFIWPASHIPFAKPAKVPTEVSLGFCYGNLLSNEQGLLLKENRKQVYLIKFTAVDQIEERVLTEIINEAILVDETFKKKKPQKKA
jgi:uncharacterized protein YdhG (YjbR/CyaY superfamily)